MTNPTGTYDGGDPINKAWVQMTNGTALRGAAALCLVVGMAAPSSAQVDERLPAVLSPSVTGSVASPETPNGARTWTGTAGASGHPLMTVEAIQAAAANFPTCIAGLWPAAARRGI